MPFQYEAAAAEQPCVPPTASRIVRKQGLQLLLLPQEKKAVEEAEAAAAEERRKTAQRGAVATPGFRRPTTPRRTFGL